MSPHYFEPTPDSPSAPATYSVALPDTSFTIRSDRGVFSHGALDTGTRLLLLEAPAPAPSGELLDLGCGAGPIAITLARRSPGARVWAVDVNERARALCTANAESNRCPNIEVAAPDDVPDDLRFATIWSNPPIRIGKAALHEMLRTWLPRLAPGGSAILVVQKHLGSDSLAAWIERDLALPVTRFRSRAGYRLLQILTTEPAHPS